jgi:methionyl-tRNA formyltransferase
MRVVFAGTPEVAVPALDALHASAHEVVGVVTRPDAPAGRGRRLVASPVALRAEELGLPVLKPEHPRDPDFQDALRALRPDACPVVAYGALLPQAALDIPPHGWINLHFSLLPAWRGAAPVQHAVLAGDTRTGVTCFVLEAGMDTGPVLLTAETGIAPDETAGELVGRLAVLGAPVLVDAVRGLVNGSLTPVPQDHDRATLAPKITPGDARLDWSQDAGAVVNAVRAFNPMPGAWTTLRGERVKVHRVSPVDDEAGGAPGSVTAGDEGGPAVACGRGAVTLLEVQPAGKPRMAGTDFVNGYRPVGEQLL